MSGYTKFAVVGAGRIGNCIVQELLKGKAAGIVKEVIVLTRQVKYPSNNQVVHGTSLGVDTKGSKRTIEGDAKVIQVDYSNDKSIKSALTGVDVVISAVSIPALGVQGKVAAAAKNADVKLFVPSEYGHITEGDTEGLHGTKANIQGQLKALGLPYAAFYTGKFSDFGWSPYVPYSFSYSIQLTTGSKGLLHTHHDWESVRRWRRQQADYVHRQTRCCPIYFLRLDPPSSRTIEESFLCHRW
jgi:uncharacterized protein YbjT (DUF2867 family)